MGPCVFIPEVLSSWLWRGHLDEKKYRDGKANTSACGVEVRALLNQVSQCNRMSPLLKPESHDTAGVQQTYVKARSPKI